MTVAPVTRHRVILKQRAAEHFARDVAEHELTVLHHFGVYRHLRAQKPGTLTYWFEVVTWSGMLVINGDMGTYAFKRLPDMFEFFRSPNGRINPDYWSEKVTAGQTETFSRDSIAEWFEDRLREWIQYNEDSEEEPLNIEERVQELKLEHVSGLYFDDEATFYDALEGWADSCPLEPNPFDHDHMYDVPTKEWDFAFLWCLHAIVWAIQQYDALPTPVRNTVRSQEAP